MKASLMKGLLAVVLILFGCLTGICAAEDTWPCEVLLCLSNPAGPTAVAECKPPIDKLFSEMKKPHFKFPECKEANAGGTMAVMKTVCYDFCPAGYSDLASGAMAVSQAAYEGGKVGGMCYTDDGDAPKWKGNIYSGLEDEGSCSIGPFGSGQNVPKPCVKSLRSTVNLCAATGIDDDGNDKFSTLNNVGVYDDVIVLQPFKTSTVVDIYIDNAFYKRVPLYFN